MALDSLNPLGVLGTLGKLATLGNAPNVAGAVVDAEQGTKTSTPSFTLSNLVVIVLGLLLIAAGLFTFDRTREYVVRGAKAAAATVA